MCEIASKHKNVRFLHLQTLHSLWIQTREQCVGPMAIQPLHRGQHLFTRVIKVVPLPYPLLARIGEEVLRLGVKQGQHSCLAITNEGISIRRRVALRTSWFYTVRSSYEACARARLRRR